MALLHTSRRAITMVETVLATLIIGTVLVSTIQIVPPIVSSSSLHTNRMIAANLARELAEEIATKRFTDPTELTTSLGLDTGERAAFRIDFDDIDDYQSWASTPPAFSTTQSMVNLIGWTRSVKVIYVNPDNPSLESGTPTNLKLVVVTISRNGTVLNQSQTLHTAAADISNFVVGVGE